MAEVLSWLSTTLLTPGAMQTIIVMTFVSALGLALGRLQIARVSLGVTFVFFMGILMAHLGVRTDETLTSFLQSFGLVLFVYALGVEVGPSFFPSLRNKGVLFNLQSFLMIALTYILILALHYMLGISMPNLLGIMSGAVTNTPVLAAVQSSLQASGLPDAVQMSSEATMAMAVSYPLGIVGVILALMLLYRLAPAETRQEKEAFRSAYVAEFLVTNSSLGGKSISEIVRMIDKPFIISRIWRDEQIHLPTSSCAVQTGDHLLVLCHEEEQQELAEFFGERADSRDWNSGDVNWDALDAGLSSKRIIITNPKVNGVKLGALKLRNKYGINITRIDRVGVELLATPDLYLQTGDRLVVVGEGQALERVEQFLGNSISLLDKPRLVSFFFGLCLGCILGLIPIYLPGMNIPISLGLAGGPIVMGILMGAFGPRLHLATYMTNSATQLIKQFGLTLFLAGLGLSNGAGFVDTLLKGDGLLWLGVGFVITTVPSLLVALYVLFVQRRNFAEMAGMVCGTMANPFALDYASELTGTRTSSIAYATVYPVAMFVRIITAQILLLFFI